MSPDLLTATIAMVGDDMSKVALFTDNGRYFTSGDGNAIKIDTTNNKVFAVKNDNDHKSECNMRVSSFEIDTVQFVDLQMSKKEALASLTTMGFDNDTIFNLKMYYKLYEAENKTAKETIDAYFPADQIFEKQEYMIEKKIYTERRYAVAAIDKLLKDEDITDIQAASLQQLVVKYYY